MNSNTYTPQQYMAQGNVAPVNSEPEVLRNLIVNYIPSGVNKDDFRSLFAAYGPIENVKIMLDRETHQPRGFGFVKYIYAQSAVQAIQYLNGYPLMNKRLKVAYAKADEARGAIERFSVMSQIGGYPQMMMMSQGVPQQQQQPQYVPQQQGMVMNQAPQMGFVPQQQMAPQLQAHVAAQQQRGQ